MSQDLRTELNDCDNVTGFSGDGASPGLNTDTGQRYEGTGSIDTQHTDANEHMWTTQTSGGGGTFDIDISDSTVYLLVKDNLVDTLANGGVQITLGDGTDDIGYEVGGNDDVGLPTPPFFNSYKLDVSERVTTPGNFVTYAGTESSLSQSSITQVGYGSLHLAKALGVVVNVFLDRITYIANGSPALLIDGGFIISFKSLSSVFAEDVAGGWGMINNPLGEQYTFFAPTQFGHAVASADTYLGFIDEQWTLDGRNIGDGNFSFSLRGNATDATQFLMVRGFVNNLGGAAPFDFSDADVDLMQIEESKFTDLGVMTMPANHADKWCNDTIFVNVTKLIPSSLDMDSCRFIGGQDPDGALIWNEDTTDFEKQINFSFIQQSVRNAIEVAPVGAGPFIYNIDGFSFDGYNGQSGAAAGRIFYINPGTLSADITINLTNVSVLNIKIGGDGLSFREAGSYTGTLIINNIVAIDIAGLTEGAAAKVIANETVGTITAGDVIGEVLADASGVTAMTLNYETAFDPSGLDVIVRARQQGLPNFAISEDNAVFVDQTTAANSAALNDMTLLLAAPVAGQDWYYFGHAEQFTRLKLDISTAGTGGFALDFEYWNGSSWTNLSSVSDGTSAYTLTGENIISWTLPGDWATTSVDGNGPVFYIRIGYLSGTVTIAPLGKKCKLDVTRYLPFVQNRIITATGLSVFASWAVDSIAKFDSND